MGSRITALGSGITSHGIGINNFFLGSDNAILGGSGTKICHAFGIKDKSFGYKYAGLSLRAGGRGFSPAIMNISPGYFHSKIEPKELPQKNLH